jgi:ribosomal-protein-alanine N-acetyltransferase
MAVTGGDLLLRITPLRPEDLDRVAQIEVRSFTMPWTPEMFLAERERADRGEVFVARAAEEGTPEVVGYVCLWLIGEEVHITNIAVDAARRRRGIGSRLVAFAVSWARRHRARRVTLEVRASNHAAQVLYRHFGFRAAGTRPRYYDRPTEDAVIMTLEPIPPLPA